jgi:hypothetical protein
MAVVEACVDSAAKSVMVQQRFGFQYKQGKIVVQNRQRLLGSSSLKIAF